MSEPNLPYQSDPLFTPEQVACFQAGLNEVDAKQIEFLYPDPIKLIMAIPEFRSHGYPDLSSYRQQVQPGRETQVYREHPTVPLPRLGQQSRPGSKVQKVEPQPAGMDAWLVGLSSIFRQSVATLNITAQGHLLVMIMDLCKNPVAQRGDVVRHLPGELGRFWRYQAGTMRLVYFPDRAYRRVMLLYLDSG